MSLALPLSFWQQGRNEPEGFVWCRHVKRYLRWQFSNCEIQSFIDSVGFRDYNRFENAIGDWLDLKKPIPDEFIKAVGVQGELLNSILDIDQREFSHALRNSVPPKLFWVEDNHGNLVPYALPTDTSEHQAIAYIERYLLTTPNPWAYLHWFNLRTIIFEKGRATFTVEYRPHLHIHDGHYSFGKDGSTLPTRAK